MVNAEQNKQKNTTQQEEVAQYDIDNNKTAEMMLDLFGSPEFDLTPATKL